MEHAAHLVDVLDVDGKIIGTKPRREINKSADIYHVIFVFLITPQGEVVLGVIPAREDLPNIYSRQMGSTLATIRRTGETPEEAAERGVQRELFIDKADLKLLGEQMMHTSDGLQTYATTYYMIGEPPATYSVIDIDTLVVVTPQQLRNLIMHHPDEIAPSLKFIWESYSSKLPI
jgi:hypothetical protein